jgi:hypothetical protein
MDKEFEVWCEQQFDGKGKLELDLGMCLSAFVSILDDPEEWQEAEIEYFMCVAYDLLETFKAKYKEEIDHYSECIDTDTPD